MKQSTASRGLGLLLQSLAVIVSILIAFALDAWWAERSLRRDLLDDLVSVTQELETNVVTLEVEALFHRTAIASIDVLVGRIDDADGAPWLTVPDTVASFAFVFPPSYEASITAVRALISSGGLSRLRDPRLKQILGNFEAQAENIREGELGARRLAMEEIVPLFWETPDLASSFGRAVEYRRRGLENTPLPSRPIQIQNVAGLKNRLLLRRAWVDSSLRSIEQLRVDLEAALELLRAADGRRMADE
ncbi:MAG: hypothetical protein ACC682_16350 [Gemmatimonadota bacterium]